MRFSQQSLLFLFFNTQPKVIMINKTSPMYLLTVRLNMIGQAIETKVKEKFMEVTIPTNLSLEVTSKQNNNTLPTRSFSIVDNTVTPEPQQYPNGYGGPGNFGPRPMYGSPKHHHTNVIEVVNSNENGKDFTVLYGNSGYRGFVNESYSFQEIETASDSIFKSLLNTFLEIEHNNSTPRFKDFEPGKNNSNQSPQGYTPPGAHRGQNQQGQFPQPFVSGFQQHMNPVGLGEVTSDKHMGPINPMTPQATFAPKFGEAGFGMSNENKQSVNSVSSFQATVQAMGRPTKPNNNSTKKAPVVKKTSTKK